MPAIKKRLMCGDELDTEFVTEYTPWCWQIAPAAYRLSHSPFLFEAGNETSGLKCYDPALDRVRYMTRIPDWALKHVLSGHPDWRRGWRDGAG